MKNQDNILFQLGHELWKSWKRQNFKQAQNVKLLTQIGQLLNGQIGYDVFQGQNLTNWTSE